MRIQSCHIRAFGHFHDVHLDALDHPVVVIQGDNEAGKTSFFHFLRSIFYGLYPTDASKHPYLPRNGAVIEGEVVFQLDEGAPVTVSRRLRSSPQGSMQADGEDTVDLRNRTIPFAQHVPQSVFESVYALQLDDLVALDGAAWDEVQDRLLGSLSMDHIRPARTVIEELEDEATDLWRLDNRGKPAAKQLEARRRTLRKEVREARRRDREIREYSDTVERLDREIQALKDEKIECTARQNRAERLNPVRQLLEKIDELESVAGDLSPFREIPDDPHVLLTDLDTQLGEISGRLEEKQRQIEELQKDVAAPGDHAETLAEHASQIRGWVKRSEVLQTRQQQAEEATRTADARQRDLEQRGDLLEDGWGESYAEAVRQLSLSDVRERIRSYETAAQAEREARSTAETLDIQSGAETPLATWIAVAGLGAIITVGTWWVPMPIAGGPAVGAMITIIGIWQTLSVRQENLDREAQRQALNLEQKADEARARAASVANILSALPLPAPRTEAPSSDLLDDLRDLKEAVRSRDEAQSTAKRLADAVTSAEQSVRELAEACGLTSAEASGDVPDVMAELERRLNEAEENLRAASEANEALPGLREQANALQERHADLQARLDRAASALRTLGDGDLEAGIEQLDDRRTARQRADLARDTLHSEYPDWASREEEIDALSEPGETWALGDEERARIRERLEEIGEALQEKQVRRASAKKDIEHLMEEVTVAEVESELAAVENELAEVERQRDRLMLLAQVIRKADADFRRKHQPDVIRRASAIVSSVTNGRYERLELQDDGQRLVAYNAGRPVSVRPPMSQGTLDQIYLAIRLAIVDHLDDGRNRLPLFLDEVFVNWDRERREGAFDVLASMSEQRQLFFFTCHPYFAQEVATHLNGTRIDLNALRLG